ncbi:MAG: integrase core domain-containing protein, partial [Actinobacteria bacterium]|nr:integrase core domain-containing protein [Actinomycetota bacterium]
WGISRQTYYRYRKRYRLWGEEGLEDLTRTPFRCPGQISPELEDKICRMRKDHPRWGARTIRNYLRREGIDPPAISTIHQALRRNHLIADQPKKRPKATKRFVRPVPNDLWQMDAMAVKLTTGAAPYLVSVLDDHARYLLAVVATHTPTGEAAWRAFSQAAEVFGLPRQVLSDNHLAFTGRLFHLVVEFERRLKAAGVTLINGAPGHPQTQGKIERYHKTIREWLTDEGPPSTIGELQQLMDRFRTHYNEVRPHQALPGDVTPAERYFPSPELLDPEQPLPEEPSYPADAAVRSVTANGTLTYANKRIGVGVRWSGRRVRVVRVAELTHVYYGDLLIRSLKIDPTRKYQHRPDPDYIGRRHRP